MFIFSGKSRSCSGTFATCIAASKEYLTRRQIIFIYLESTFYHLCYRKVFFKLVNFPRVVQENKIRCIIYYETNTLYAVVTTAWSRNERQKDSDRRSTENVLKQKSSNINKIKKTTKDDESVFIWRTHRYKTSTCPNVYSIFKDATQLYHTSLYNNHTTYYLPCIHNCS